MDSHSTPASYNFQPLEENGIRLFKIQPELRNGYIACSLYQCDDKSIPPYDALSYLWGDPQRTERIFVNDALVDIHKALWEFLDQMWQSQRTGNWIWTDFLCLDQRNDREMGQQIPRMGTIYTEARRTISWLGCDKSSWILNSDRPANLDGSHMDLKKDLEIIAQRLADKRHHFDHHFRMAEGLFQDPSANVSIEPVYGPDHLRSSIFGTRHRFVPNELPVQSSILGPLAALERLPVAASEILQLGGASDDTRIQGTGLQVDNILCMPYWKRAWIAQEVALAKEVILMFGDASLNFDDFLLAYKASVYCMIEYRLPAERYLRVPVEARAAVHERVASQQVALENTVSLHHILQWGGQCEASKPADRIYGLLGLLKRCGHGGETLPSILTGTIDYRREAEGLFWEVALTYRPQAPTHPSYTFKYGYQHALFRWMDSLPRLAQPLSCSFTVESLRCADNERATPLCRQKARLALRFIDICRQVGLFDRIGGLQASLPSVSNQDGPWASKEWPNKPYARQLGFVMEPTDLTLVMGSLLVETDEGQGMAGADRFDSIIMGYRLFLEEGQGVRGLWSCVPHQSEKGPHEHDMDIEIEYHFGLGGFQLPCSLLSNTSSPSSLQSPHRCKSSERYLAIEGIEWKLTLLVSDAVEGKHQRIHAPPRSFPVERDEIRRGILNIKY